MSEFTGQRKDGGVSAPIGLGGLFGDSESDGDCHNEEAVEFDNITENQTICLVGTDLVIRQYSYHKTNANQVWPGTFTLATFMEQHRDRYGSPNEGTDGSHSLLELGAATGALSIYLRKLDRRYHMITSDIDDGGEVAENVEYNILQNGLSPGLHIPHTWGEGWQKSVDKATARSSSINSINTCSNSIGDAAVATAIAHRYIKFVIASDILLYVSAYPALVETLVELFGINTTTSSSSSSSNGNLAAAQRNEHKDIHNNYNTSAAEPTAESSSSSSSSQASVNGPHHRGRIQQAPVPVPAPVPIPAVEFLMAWNRRISTSAEFFDAMQRAGFLCYHHGHCIYSFFTPAGAAADPYLDSLRRNLTLAPGSNYKTRANG